MSTKNEDQTTSGWLLKPVQAASIILAGVYLAGFLVLNAHLGKWGFYDFDLANSRHLIAGGLFVGFLVFWYLFAGRAIILMPKWLRGDLAFAKEHGLSPIWNFVAFVNSLVKVWFLTCLSATFFSFVILGRAELYPVYAYLVVLFLIAYPWDFLNYDVRFPRASQVFEFVSKAMMISIFFITIDSVASPTMTVFLHFAVMSVFANLVLDSYERFKLTIDHVTYSIIYSFVFILMFSVSFGKFHYGEISSALGGGQLQPVEIMIDDQTVWNGLQGMGFEVTPFFKTKLLHENEREVVIDLEGQIVRLPREAIAGIKMLPVENSPWLMRYLN